jgi:hypothetical protein
LEERNYGGRALQDDTVRISIMDLSPRVNEVCTTADLFGMSSDVLYGMFVFFKKNIVG